MPLLREGPLAGCYLPDYGGGSIVELLASIIRSRGGSSPHADLAALPASRIAGAPCLLYLVIDGLGLAQLRRHLERGQGRRFFAAHNHVGISTVFPATTAAAVTTFDTGASPAEHGILSWYLHLPDHGCIATVLRTTTRIGTPLFPEGYDLQAYYQVPSYLASARDHLGLLSWGEIPRVPFAEVGTRWPDRRSYPDLDGLVATTLAFAYEGGRRLAYVYWPRYDGLCHEKGCEHPEVDAHFELIDAALAQLVDGLAGSGTVLCVLADHGLVDVAPERCIDLARVPGLMSCLATAPAGDQRQMSLFVRPRKLAELERIFTDHLAEATTMVAGEELLAAGVFGPGIHHPALAQRLGDVVLLAKDDHAMVHTPPGMAPVFMPGSHGGMSEAELRIPLFTIAT
ncbi:MAG: alkaline phosphatase family protein [Deltaproteobacteria bacterium]|nr:alkaline phosphatase family protein [Nannocystaceae bacterium]